MVRMQNQINRTYFGGQQVVTCFSCHWGTEVPKSTPRLSLQYAPPAPMEPEVITEQDRNAPQPGQLIDKYIEAMGGAQKVNALKSYAGSGNYQAYSASEQGSVDIYAKAPDQRSIVFHTASGDSTTVYDGKHGWASGPDDLTPLPVVALSGSDLNGFRTDALIFFPSQIKKNLTKLRTGAPFVWNGMNVNIVQGTDPGGVLVMLYFDTKTNLLVREVRYIKTIIGTNPYEIDYSDFRDSGGIKTPFHVVIYWTDGRSTIQLDKVQWNTTLPATAFAQPKPPKPLANEAELR
jgi:outer membrane lipoprotein-sorting protein